MLLLALVLPSMGATLFQDTVQGGLAVDGSGVSTNSGGASTWTSGPDIDVDIPSTATVTEIYLVLSAKNGGLPGNVTNRVRVNGVSLASATSVDSGTRYEAFELDPSTFSITASGSVTYEETGHSDSGSHSGTGVSGASLYVIYEDSSLSGQRHLTVESGYLNASGSSASISGLPTSGTTGEMLLSVAIGWECADEQDGTVTVDGSTLATGVGGRDDGDSPNTSCSGDWNSLLTVGSFGFDATSDEWVGVDSDDPDAEPASGTSANSRLSDELWATSYDESGSLTLGYSTSSPDSWMSSYAVVVELDGDEDGVRDADDNCPSTANAGQGDADGDGTGDACDSCTDVDGDGYGDSSYSASTCTADCDDSDASVTLGSTWYEDSDSDGYGDAGSSQRACSQPAGWVTDSSDCDDADADTNPGADEYCDGHDDDCDGSIDEDSAVDVATWYADSDGDGYGDASVSDIDCSQPSGYEADDSDCDDTDDTVHPSASELCDGQDNDCDGSVPSDESDDDGDGFIECSIDSGGWDGSGATPGEGDCDDSDADSFPGAAANDSATACMTDADGDDYGSTTAPSGGSAGTDCDDSDASINSGATEVCDNLDNDCDGTVDEDDASDASTWYADTDSDGYGDPAVSDIDCDQPSGFVADDSDCDDDDAAVNPAATEIAYDGIDQDCSGADLCDVDEDGFNSVDCTDGLDCDDDDETIHPDAEERWYDGVDQDCAEDSDYDADGDGFDSATYGGEDCDDADADVWPGAPDDPYDGVVTDCDAADEYDADGDGFDSVEYGGEDCDDANSAIHPDAIEEWYDGVDDNCDGNDDDQDEDGWSVDEDCDDTDPDIYPGAPGLDEDCGPEDTANPQLDTGGLGSDVGGGAGFEAGKACDGCAGGGMPSGGLVALLVGVAGALRRRD